MWFPIFSLFPRAWQGLGGVGKMARGSTCEAGGPDSGFCVVGLVGQGSSLRHPNRRRAGERMLPLSKDQRKQGVERRSLGITTRGFEMPSCGLFFSRVAGQ